MRNFFSPKLSSRRAILDAGYFLVYLRQGDVLGEPLDGVYGLS
jgi:hypothetical protein